jgi:hypothetical protein
MAPIPSWSLARVVAFLRDFKELIAICLFFGGGAIWVVGYFATRTQLTELHCRTEKRLDLLGSGIK